MNYVHIPMLRRLGKLTMSFVIIAALAYAIIVFFAWWQQDRLMFFPDAAQMPPTEVGLTGAQEITLTMTDGTKIVAWERPADSDTHPVILYFHGNGGRLAHRGFRFTEFERQGWGFLAMTYRSYGGSEGKPNEPNMIADGEAMYQRLIDQGIAPERIVFYGESLGTGVATQLAARHPGAALILETPYNSTAGVAEAHYKLPARWLMRNQFRSVDHIADIDMPLLWLHGTKDIVIPIRLGQKLFDLAEDPKSERIYPGSGHANLWDFGAREDVVAFVNRLDIVSLE